MEETLRECVGTKQSFEPNNADHFFVNEMAFEKFIEEIDPLKEFVIQKREIDWEPRVRECRECGETFLATHPAMHYCEEHRTTNEDTDTDTDSQEIETQTEGKVKSCDQCGRKFLATAPAMKYCQLCSPKGGKLIEEQN